MLLQTFYLFVIIRFLHDFFLPRIEPFQSENYLLSLNPDHPQSYQFLIPKENYILKKILYQLQSYRQKMSLSF